MIQVGWDRSPQPRGSPPEALRDRYDYLIQD
jgi:hypothetical protein